MNKALSTYKKISNDDDVVHISDAITNDGQYTEPYPIGYSVFDEAMMGGVRMGDLVIITGLPGQGKTLTCSNICANMSKQSFPVLFFSYEMPVNNIYARFKEMGVNDDSLLVFTPKHNTSGNLKWVKEKINEGYVKHATKFVFIDHLDYLSPTNIKSSDQKRMILKDICQELKLIAMDLSVVIFLVAHVKKVSDRAIQLNDIAETAGLGQLSDYVFCVTRKLNAKTVNGIKQYFFDDVGVITTLKNRLTGLLPSMEFGVSNNTIMPISIDPEEIKNFGYDD